jgi:hypothetical protein
MADPTLSPFATTPGTPQTSTGISGMVDQFRSALGSKNKGGAQNLSPMVPTAAGGFYQPVDTAGRSGLLQAMMQRSRAGRNPTGMTGA